MDIIIRKAEKKDMESLLKLMDYLLSLESDFPNKQEAQKKGFSLVLESNIADVFVAELEGNVVGMCSLHLFISTVQGGYAGVVEDVVVDEAYSGMGIGSLLLEHIEKYAKSEGVSRLQLMVYQQNESAIAFYKKHGWTETDYVGFRKYI